jgi:hypothetical protein
VKATAALAFLAVAADQPGAAPTDATSIEVPFVGCASDGQVGPRAAPRAGHPPRLAADAAARLAFYGSAHLGVLAPRGWHCFEAYGSNGSFLVVAPAPIGFEDLGGRGPDLGGSFVMIAERFGGTSGRFEVAEAIARYFPGHIAFARAVADRWLMDPPLPEGPYPADNLDRRSDTQVRLVTPGWREGFGTAAGIAVEDRPIYGAALLLPDQEFTLITVRARLPDALADLAPFIIEQSVAQHRPPR